MVEVNKKEENAQDSKSIFGGLDSVLSIMQYVRDAIKELDLHLLKKEQVQEKVLHLEEICLDCEKSANIIMENTELLMNLAENLEGEEKQKVEAAAIKIIEACHFQDLTGQRIQIVADALETYGKSFELLFGEQFEEVFKEAFLEALGKQGESSNKSLMNGPQLSEDAKSQSEIDDLFSNA